MRLTVPRILESSTASVARTVGLVFVKPPIRGVEIPGIDSFNTQQHGPQHLSEMPTCLLTRLAGRTALVAGRTSALCTPISRVHRLYCSSSRSLHSSVAFSRHSLGVRVPCRGLSSAVDPQDPYKTLGLGRDASDDDIKKAFRKRALETHPDKVLADRGDATTDADREDAQNAFARVGNAYEILKDPEKRREYDVTGRVDGGGRQHPGNHAEHMRMVREWLQRQQRQPPQPPPRVFPEEDMEARIRFDVECIHRASRASHIGTKKDGRRAAHAGKEAVVAAVDPNDGAVKVRVMVSPGRAEELWYGGGALWDPRLLKEGLEALVCPDVDAIHKASRAVGIGEKNDGRRSNCAGRRGTVVRVDHQDQTAIVRVLVTPSRADELWFGVAAIEPYSAS